MADNSKLKILYILDIMKKTDEHHPVNSTQIASQLKKYGIEAERKSIVRDIKCLEMAGYEIKKCDNHNLGWYMIEQEFEDYELKMLSDAVASAKFLTIEDSRQMIKKIKKLATKEGERLINATLIMDTETKSDNKKTNIIFDTIVRAIADSKQISFQYYELTNKNEKALKRNGHIYQVNPYFIALINEQYYLICNPISHNRVTHFRIEMITNINIIDNPCRPMREIEELKDIGNGKTIEDYICENTNMWSGKPTDVILSGSNGCRQTLLKKFGSRVSMRDNGDDGFIAHIKVTNSEGFYFWLASYAPYMTIHSPSDMRNGFIKFLKTALDNYSDDKKGEK